MQDFDYVFRAIANRTRREILTYLSHKTRAVPSSDIHGRFACSWPTLCEHLRKLEECGLVSKQDVGREVHYAIRRQRLIGIVKTWVCSFED